MTDFQQSQVSREDVIERARQQREQQDRQSAVSGATCPKCGHAMEADAYPDIFSGYCRNCGYRDRIDKSEMATASGIAADTSSAEWRRAHGFPD